MMKKKKSLFLFFMFILVFVIFTTSCTNKQEKPIPIQEETKIPEHLSSMSEETDKIIEKIEQIDEEIKKPEFKEETSKEEDKEENKEEKSEKSNEEEEKDNSTEDEQQTSREEKIYSMWEEIKTSVEGIHESWNNYEVEAIDIGIDKDEMLKFEEALNKFTIAVDKQKYMDSLIESNQMILFMSSFFDFYKGSSQGDILRMKYYIRQTYLCSMVGDWEGASKSMEESDTVLKQLRKKTLEEDEAKKLVEKLDLSLDNMENGIKENNLELLKIKRDIALKNLEELRDELEGKVVPAFYNRTKVN